MHYRNGREVKNGDEIVQINENGQIIHIGVLICVIVGDDYCNGMIADDRTKFFSGACMCDCLHMEDIAAMLIEKGLSKRPVRK